MIEVERSLFALVLKAVFAVSLGAVQSLDPWCLTLASDGSKQWVRQVYLIFDEIDCPVALRAFDFSLV